jgi:hypothetical protein
MDQHLYIIHASCVTESETNNKKYLLDKSALDKSIVLKDAYDTLINESPDQIPLITVKCGNEDALIFIIKYLNTYKNEEEAPAPPSPLPDAMHLDDVFANERHIFEKLLIIDSSTDINKKIKEIAPMLAITTELKLDILHNKLAAIISKYMMSI